MTWLTWPRESPAKPNSRYALGYIDCLKACPTLDLLGAIPSIGAPTACSTSRTSATIGMKSHGGYHYVRCLGLSVWDDLFPAPISTRMTISKTT